MYLVGKHIKEPIYPAPLKLYNEDLPFVTHATHLGHELNQDSTMDMDIRMKQTAFISNSVEIRNMFWFAIPIQVLKAVQTYSAHNYGSMLWDLYVDAAGQMFRSWNTCGKLAWN